MTSNRLRLAGTRSAAAYSSLAAVGLLMGIAAQSRGADVQPSQMIESFEGTFGVHPVCVAITPRGLARRANS